MNRIKKFYRDHKDEIALIGFGVLGIAAGSTASAITVWHGVKKFEIADIQHDFECKEPIHIFFRNGRATTYYPTKKETV